MPARRSPDIPVRKPNGDAIRAVRELTGVRPIDLAARVGISRTYLLNIEAGRKSATPATLARIAGELGVPLAAVTSVQLPCQSCHPVAA